MRNAYLQQCNYGSRFRILKGGKISLVVSALIASTTLLHANPSGGVVTSGSASIAQSGTVTNITQSTNKAAINWQNFSIATNETVNFKQPNVSSVTLNRVVGNEKSIIDGALNANGQVFLLNSNGVLFSKNASINTAGLIATTMNLSDTDFMNGNYTFEGESQASIINQGTINISDKGYAALFGKEVANEGIIKATLGKVHLTGASEVTLNLNGNSLVNLTVNKGVLDALVENKGAIYADGGDIYLTTNAVNELLRGVVNNTGIIEANSIDDITGKIELYAHGGALHVSGTLKAKEGFIETSGKTLHVSDEASIKAKEWLIDPDDITVESTGSTTDLTGSSVKASFIESTLNGGTGVTLTADNSITVNEDITWSTTSQLTLNATNTITLNATIANTNTINGGVYFHAANTTDKVIFGTNGKVIIYNPYQLQWMNTALAGKYELGGTIDASDTSTWNTGAGFVPIGNNSTKFTGSFDGLGNTIDALSINLPLTDYVGLFGYVEMGSTIQNIGLTNNAIIGYDNVGGLVGHNEGYITNAYTTGSVRGNIDVGGLVGRNEDTIANAYVIGSVSGNSYIGSFVGNNGGTITTSFWNTEGAGQSQGVGSDSSSGVTGKTTEELQQAKTFADKGWVIEEDAILSATYLYPVLTMNSGIPIWKIKVAPSGPTAEELAAAEAARIAAEQEAARIANRNAAIEAANARIRAQQEAIKRAAIEAERAAKAEAARIAAEAANAARLAAIEAARLAAEAAEAARLAAEQEAARIANRNAAIEAANARIRAQQEAIKRAAKEEANRLAAEAANAARLAARHSNTETQTMGSATQSPMGGSISSVATQSNTPIAQFSNNGQTYDVFLQPVAGVATQEVSLQQLSSLMGIQGSSDVKIPLLQGVSLNFTQGGINLPAGINQQFFIAQR